MEGDMYRGIAFIAASALALSASSGFAAGPIPCGTTDPVTHGEPGFHFFDVSTSHRWRASVSDGAHCTQVIYNFLPSGDAGNKSGNDFTAEKATKVVAVPGCSNPAALDPVFTGGRIDVYCSVRDGGATHSRWATIAIWTRSPDYHGGAYAIITSNTSPTPEPMYVGTGVDPINQAQKFTYILTAEP
jgi:hypothetical protein